MYKETVELEEGKYYWKQSKIKEFKEDWTVSKVTRESGELCIDSRLWLSQALEQFIFVGRLSSSKEVS